MENEECLIVIRQSAKLSQRTFQLRYFNQNIDDIDSIYIPLETEIVPVNRYTPVLVLKAYNYYSAI